MICLRPSASITLSRKCSVLEQSRRFSVHLENEMDADASNCKIGAFLFKNARHFLSLCDRRGSGAGVTDMRYVMKQKIFSWGDDFCIQNDAGQDMFFVDGRAFSLGNKLCFKDMGGNELAFVQQKLLSWGPTYEIYRSGQLAAAVKKQLF